MTLAEFGAWKRREFFAMLPHHLKFESVRTSIETRRSRKGSFLFSATLKEDDPEDEEKILKTPIEVTFLPYKADYTITKLFKTDDETLLETGDALAAYLSTLTGKGTKRTITDTNLINAKAILRIKKCLAGAFATPANFTVDRKGSLKYEDKAFGFFRIRFM